MLSDAEINQPDWWCNHHKESIKWLLIMMNKYFTSGKDDKETIESILRNSMPNFAKEIGVVLDETPTT